jgi:hypothetical protein
MSFPSRRLASAVAHRGYLRRYRDTSTRVNLRRMAAELEDVDNSAIRATGGFVQGLPGWRARQIAEVLRAVADEYVEEKTR